MESTRKPLPKPSDSNETRKDNTERELPLPLNRNLFSEIYKGLRLKRLAAQNQSQPNSQDSSSETSKMSKEENQDEMTRGMDAALRRMQKAEDKERRRFEEQKALKFEDLKTAWIAGGTSQKKRKENLLAELDKIEAEKESQE